MPCKASLVRAIGPVLVVFLAGCAAPASKQPQTAESDLSDADLARALSAELAAAVRRHPPATYKPASAAPMG